MTTQGDGRLGRGRIRCRHAPVPGQRPSRRAWLVRGLLILLLLALLAELYLLGRLVPEYGAWLKQWLFQPLWEALKWALQFGVLLLLWTAFFAQFLLPLEQVEDRWQMVKRVLLHALGWAGPVLWVQDGQILSVADELLCQGPGLVVTDLASAVVLRDDANFTRVVPPGRVSFLRTWEAVADVLDLRDLTRIVGPKDGEDPFAPRQKDEEDQAYRQRQERYRETRGVTRDGIEAVPRIWLLFHLKDEDPLAAEDTPEATGGWGTLDRCLNDRRAMLRNPARRRFPRFRTIYHGTAEAAFWAVASRPIDVFFKPHRPAEAHSDQHVRLPWDWIPAAMAADLWRDYVSRFAFDELFEPLEHHEGRTGLEVIQHLIEDRLTKPVYQDVDEQGLPGEHRQSLEYHELDRRGLRVKKVVIIGIAFPPEVERDLAQLRVNTWMQGAQVEREMVERERALAQESGEAQALAHLCGYCTKDFPAFEREHLDAVLWQVTHHPQLHLPPEIERRKIWALGEMVLRNVAAWVNRAELRQRLGAHEAGRLRKLLALLRQYRPVK